VKLTKQRKVYAAFLGLAAVAFIADRMMFQPAGAGAATLPQDGEATPAEAAAEASGAAKPSPAAASEPMGPTLSEKLATAPGAVDSTRNPFQQPWRGVTVSPATGGKSKAGDELVTASEFAAKYELTAVSKLNEVTVAVIGNAARQVGAVVEGWKLVAIEDRTVTLERGTQRVTLALRGTSMPDNAIVPRRTGQGGTEGPNQ